MQQILKFWIQSLISFMETKGEIFLGLNLWHFSNIFKNMSQSLIVQGFDRLSPVNIMRGGRSSWFGVIGTLMVVVLCLIFYVPAVISYFQGNFKQYMYSHRPQYSGNFYSTDDYKLAVVFRNIQTGRLYNNHTYLLSALDALVQYQSPDNYYSAPLQACNETYFANDINGIVLDDCLIIPEFIEYIVGQSQGQYSILVVTIQPHVSTIPFANTGYKLTPQQEMFADIMDNYYYQFYFTSRVINNAGSIQFQMHKLYSSLFNMQSTSNSGIIAALMGTRITIMDNSIMPWRNNKNISTLQFQGDVGIDQFYQQCLSPSCNYATIAKSGINTLFYAYNYVQYAFRYYKKLDWLLGIIGGGMFLFFLIGMALCSFINKALMKLQLVNEQLLQKTTLEPLKNQDELIPVKISVFNYFKNLWCKDQKVAKLIQQSQKNIDIILLIKKMKVTTRNLNRKQLLKDFQPKEVQFLEEINESQSTERNSQSFIQLDKNSEYAQDKGKRNNGVVFQGSEVDIMNDKIHKIQDQHANEVQNSAQSHSEEDQQSVKSNKSKQKSRHANVQENHQMKEVEKQAQIKLKIAQKGQTQLKVRDEVQDQTPVQTFDFDIDSAEKRKPKEVVFESQQIIRQSNRKMIQQKYQQIVQNEAVVQEVVPIDHIIIYSPRNIKNKLQLQNDKNLENGDEAKDDKFNFSTSQYNYLKNNDLTKYYENNLVYRLIKNDKSDTLQDLNELQMEDKWNGHQPQQEKGCKKFINCISSVIKYFDVFAVKVNFITQPHSKSWCGVIMTLAIITMSILTFCLTIYNMDSIQYKIENINEDPTTISFSRVTDSDFNIILCLENGAFFAAPYLYGSLTFFTVNNGVTTKYNPIRITSSDNTLNLKQNVEINGNGIPTTYCYRFPYGIPINFNANSYIGYSMSPFCSGTSAFCSANIATTNSKFLSSINDNINFLILPGSRLDTSTNTLKNDLFKLPLQTINFVAIDANMNIQETVYTGKSKLLDNRGNNFMRTGPVLIEQNLNLHKDTSSIIKNTVSNNQPSYTLKIKLNQVVTQYTLSQKKIDWLFGIMGGIFVFWYSLIHLFGYFYNKHNYYEYIAKLIYGEKGYDSNFIFKIAAMLRLPKCILLKCCNMRQDVSRMKLMQTKIENSITYLSILKYTDICYRLSTSFFSSFEAKNLSLLYFRQKIDESAEVMIEQQQQMPKQSEKQDIKLYEFVQTFSQHRNNKVMNDSVAGSNQADEKKQITQPFKCQTEDENDHIIDQQSTKITDFLDLFRQQPSFTLNQQRAVSSMFGGCCCFLMILLILIVTYYQVGAYLTGSSRSISYNSMLDDGFNSTGLSFTTGSNFKFGLTILQSSNFSPINISTLTNTIGISLLIEQYTRVNGVVIPNITSVDLVPCSTNYLSSSLSSFVDKSYYSDLPYAYCIPDGIYLQLIGSPQSRVKKGFQVSIYNKLGTAAGTAFLMNLLNTTFIRTYYTTPQHNSVERTMNYELQSAIFAYFGINVPLTPFITNVSLSKVSINYDDSTDMLTPIKNIQSYICEANLQNDQSQFQSPLISSNYWYNISFAYTNKVNVYNITTDKFYEVFGIIGGVIAFFMTFLGCCARSFNQYKLKYEVGKELYLFDKLKGRGKKSRKDKTLLKQINNFGELDLLKAYLYGFLAFFSKDYNSNSKLRRITLIQQNVSDDLSLPKFYLNLYRCRDAIDKQISSKKDIKLADKKDIKLTDIYFKPIFNPEPQKYQMSNIKNYAKQHSLSSYWQMIVSKAGNTNILREVMDNGFLQRTFNLSAGDASVDMNLMRDTVGSLNSSQIGGRSMASSYGDGTTAMDY